MSESDGKSCWQCYEHNVNFSYVLNIINELKKKKISSNIDNILDRLNVGDELNHITIEHLQEILDYACDAKYVSTHSYNKDISYCVNESELMDECSVCGDKLCPYISENFPAKTTVEFVERHVFESLALEVKSLRAEFLMELENINSEYNANNEENLSNQLKEARENLTDFDEKVKNLSTEIINKDKIIDILIAKLSDIINVTSNREKHTSQIPVLPPQNGYVSFNDANKTAVNVNDNWELARNGKHVHNNIYTPIDNPIPLFNKYSYLYNDDENLITNSQVSNQNKRSVGITAGTSINSHEFNSFYNNSRKRPHNIINKYPDNDMLLRENIKRIVPGNASYADTTNAGKKVCIFSDSITKKIDMSHFNAGLNFKGSAVKRFYPGYTASQLNNKITAHLIADKPDIVIVNVGTNNLTKSNQSDTDTLIEIVNIVKKCHQFGVKQVFVSGITCRPEYQVAIDSINHLIEINAGNYNYTYINNNNITYEHLWWKDNLHLNNEGIKLLKSNFLNYLNRHLIFNSTY